MNVNSISYTGQPPLKFCFDYEIVIFQNDFRNLHLFDEVSWIGNSWRIVMLKGHDMYEWSRLWINSFSLLTENSWIKINWFLSHGLGFGDFFGLVYLFSPSPPYRKGEFGFVNWLLYWFTTEAAESAILLVLLFMQQK